TWTAPRTPRIPSTLGDRPPVPARAAETTDGPPSLPAVRDATYWPRAGSGSRHRRGFFRGRSASALPNLQEAGRRRRSRRADPTSPARRGIQVMTTGNEETDQLWDESHVLANMTSEELRYWLLTDASGEN